MFKKPALFSFVIIASLGIINNSIFAQNQQVNPLKNNNVEDVLLPTQNRPLTEVEKAQLQADLQSLNQSAEEQLALGNEDQAVEIWYRQLSLTRFLGLQFEVQEITRLGSLFWEWGRALEINNLTARLQILEAENTVDNQLNSQYLDIFFKAYQSLGNVEKSVDIQQQILTEAREKKNQEKVKENLISLGKLYLSKFDYFNAQPIYEELLTISERENDFINQTNYLKNLSQINSALLRSDNSIIYRKRLIENYEKTDNFNDIILEKIAIGDEYKKLDQPQEAGIYYQEAFNLAWSVKRFAQAGGALKQLGILYQDYEKLDSALQIYRELIIIEQQSANFYGLMATYGRMGDIYQQQSNYAEAQNYWRRALEIAQQLNHNQEFYLNKLAELP